MPTPKLERILVPVDLSECSATALEYATGLARDLGATLDVLHVWDPPDAPRDRSGSAEDFKTRARTEVEQWLSEFVERHGGGAQLSPRIVGGTVIQAILDQAEQGQHDLIVMGTHGRRGLARLALGSVAEMVLRRANCPVLCVRTPTPAK